MSSSSSPSNNDNNNFRMLHWVHKIGNYTKSKQFYERELNMTEQRHESFDAGCEAACNGRYNLSWTKTMIGYGPEDVHFVLELTANHGIKSYKLGNDFVQVVIHHDKASDSKQTLVDPNGYTYLLVNKNRDLEEAERNSVDQVQYISLHTKNIEKQIQFYTQVLGMQVFKRLDEKRVLLGFAQDQAKLEFIQLDDNEELVHGEAFGRLAISSKIDIKEMHQRVVKSKEEEVFASTQISIVKEPIVLPTPGKADVEVTIISDCDGYEICLAEETGFLALALGK